MKENVLSTRPKILILWPVLEIFAVLGIEESHM